METFAKKIRHGSGPRFDPLLEERGRWIAGEAQKHDIEMADDVIGVMAQANQQIVGDFNPFIEQFGEILPPNLERNFSGFFMRKNAIVFKVNPDKLAARIAILKEQLLIAKFVGPKPTSQEMEMWLITLNLELRGSTLTLCRNVGKSYFFMQGDDMDALHNALMLSPFKSKWGMYMLQSWVPYFHHNNPNNLAFPTCVALR